MNKVKKGLYQHYKGPFYRVVDIARHSETQEPLVIYQALYGDKGMWARPLSMFVETIEIDGIEVPRFAYCKKQSAVLEVAILDIKQGKENEFEQTFLKVEEILSSKDGYMDHQLQRCLETSNRYILLVNWQKLEDHTVGFRQSDDYKKWREQLHHFYDPFPQVDHYQSLIF